MRVERLPGGGMRALAPAKVNLFLEVLGVRPDGYHEIDTILQEVTLHDEIEFRDGRGRGGEIRLEVVDREGRPVALGPPEDNLVTRAARLILSWMGPRRPPASLEVRLTKRIPMGAGLGGGSSDAAATLAALSIHWETGLDGAALAGLAARLGSDVAFFLHGGTARCRGRGEVVTPLGGIFDDDPLHCVLAYPGFQIPTPLIYKELDRLEKNLDALTRNHPIDTMSHESLRSALEGGDLFFNRLEPIACKVYPELESYKKEFQREPFVAALMSGSGSTIFGITRSRREAEEIADRLRGRIPGEIFVVQSERGMPFPRGCPSI